MESQTFTVSKTFIAHDDKEAHKIAEKDKEIFSKRLTNLSKDIYSFSFSPIHLREIGEHITTNSLKVYRLEFYIYKSLK